MKKRKKKINLALQGGGAHGAFTWGILDRLLESDLFIIDGVSGTSAGSVNAVLLAQGLIENGPKGAQAILRDFWHSVGEINTFYNMRTFADDFILPIFNKTLKNIVTDFILNYYSPNQINPTNINPIKDLLNSMLEIEKIKAHSPIKLFICATNVQTNKIKIFNQEEISIDAILASTCVPEFFNTVEIDKQYYWDGGYIANPALFPLIYNTTTTDILLVQLIPICRKNVPSTREEIHIRLKEIAFNCSIMREIRSVSFITQLIDNGWIKDEFKSQLKRIYLHCLRADEITSNLPFQSALHAETPLIIELFEAGQQAFDKWLEQNYRFIGKKTTANFDDWV